MKELLERAAKSARATEFDLRQAHSAAIAEKNQFAEIILLVMISDAAQLTARCNRALEAASQKESA
jgi:hypothetical protein